MNMPGWCDVDVSGGTVGYQTFFWKTAPQSDADIDPRDPLTVTLWVDEDDKAWLKKPRNWKVIAGGVIVLVVLLFFGIKSLMNMGHRPSDSDNAAKDAAIRALTQKVDLLLIENTRMSNRVAQMATLPAANPPAVSTNTPVNSTKTNGVPPTPVLSPAPTLPATNAPTDLSQRIANNSEAVSLPSSTNRNIRIDRNAGAISFGGNATVNMFTRSGDGPMKNWTTTTNIVLANTALTGTNELAIELTMGQVVEIDQSEGPGGKWLVIPSLSTLANFEGIRFDLEGNWIEWVASSQNVEGTVMKWRVRNGLTRATARFKIVLIPN
jgi:hypothetical protein